MADSYDALAKREVSVVGEYLLPVKHALLAAKGTALSEITTVYSHPQGLKQCAQFFEEHPEIEAVAVSNTAVAAQLVQAMGKRDVAAIASAYAGQLYGLEVLVPALNYRAENTTRFLVIGKEKLYPEGAKTVSLMMETRHEAGAGPTVSFWIAPAVWTTRRCSGRCGKWNASVRICAFWVASRRNYGVKTLCFNRCGFI